MVVVVPVRFALRLFFASAIVVIALILFAGRAHADDASPPDAPAPSASTPPSDSTAPTAPTAPTPPGTDSTPPPPASDSTPPPSAPQSEPTPTTPSGPVGPTDPTEPNQSNQNAGTGTTGTSVANTGDNASTATGDPNSTASGDPTANGGVHTGNSSSTGTDSTDAIDQQAHGSTSDNGAVDILQIALVVNVGVAHSGSGQNVAGAGAAGTAGNGTVGGAIQTGSAGATGDAAHTGITQSAIVDNGDNSNQNALVVNVGIAIGNTGINITIGSIANNGAPQSGQSVNVGTTSGQVIAGDANAIGDQSKSAIKQAADGLASGAAVLTIDQRAIVINFGTAFANSGGNFALASFDASQLSPEEAAIIEAVLTELAPLFGASTGTTSGTPAVPTSGSGAVGGTMAGIITGTAHAVGNASTTTIGQSVSGSVTGTGHATANQTAAVGNLGLALANTGLNGAISGVSLDALTGPHSELAAAQDSLAHFLALLTNLDWLNSANPFAQFAQTIDLGNGVTLDLGGSLTGETFLAGWDSGFAPDGGPIPGGVRVRQISGVLNIGITTSDSGHNTVIAIVAANHNGKGTNVKAANTVATASPDVMARVLTGNANAIGNQAIVTVCQAFNDTVACAPKVTPVPDPHPAPHPTPAPKAGGAVVEAAAIDAPAPVGHASVSSGTLPFTGGESDVLVEIGGALLAAGTVLASRRRRATRV